MCMSVVLKLGSIEPPGFDESVTGVQRRLGLCNYNVLYSQARQLMHTADVQQMNSSLWARTAYSAARNYSRDLLCFFRFLEVFHQKIVFCQIR